MFTFRPHRGTLQESMAAARQFSSFCDMIETISEEHAVEVSPSDIEIKPYGYDERVGWDTHIVCMRGYGVLGFTDGFPERVAQAVSGM